MNTLFDTLNILFVCAVAIRLTVLLTRAYETFIVRRDTITQARFDAMYDYVKAQHEQHFGK